MGLAASQARFLGLTARKSNVEYQGQQINQQRVALSNEVNGLYNEYNRLDVPVPPEVTDFQKTTYTLDSTYEGYQISNFSKILDGENEGLYNVDLSYVKEIATAYPYTPQASISGELDENGNLKSITVTIGADTYTYSSEDEQSNTLVKIKEEDAAKYPGLETVKEKIGSGPYYMFVKNGVSYYTNEEGIKEFLEFNNSGDETTQESQKQNRTDKYTFEYQGTMKQTQTIQAIAALEQDENGRLISINIKQCEDDSSLVGNTYSITTGTEDDQAKYQDAMNKYAYDKQIYEREVERINQKTEKLQQEDRSLEMQLNQLDTEQKAIATEMDSITKVIEDTIDSVFKTFNS